MGYHLEGRLLEVCNCRVLCPCWIGEDPDFGTCDTIVAWHFDKGKIDGVDVSDRTIALIAHVPGNILQGNWRAAVYLDDRVTSAQEQAILNVYTGKLGGPVGELVKLVGEVVSVEQGSHHLHRSRRQGNDQAGRRRLRRARAVQATRPAPRRRWPTRCSRRCPARRCSSVRRRAIGRRTPTLGIDLDIKGHNALQSTFVFDA